MQMQSKITSRDVEESVMHLETYNLCPSCPLLLILIQMFCSFSFCVQKCNKEHKMDTDFQRQYINTDVA